MISDIDDDDEEEEEQSEKSNHKISSSIYLNDMLPQTIEENGQPMQTLLNRKLYAEKCTH